MNIISIIEKIATEYPNKNAIIDYCDNSITYLELLKKADIYAKILYDNQIKKNEVVAIITDKNIAMIACMLGVLKSGATYLMIDNSLPREKIDYMLNTSSVKFIFSTKDEKEINTETFKIYDVFEMDYVNYVSCERNDKDITYIVYTSGTTNNPKGVMVDDENILNYIQSYNTYFKVSHTDIIIQQSPIYYDGFAEEIFSMLFSGGTIFLPNNIKSYNYNLLSNIIKQYGITIVPTTPSLLNEFNKKDKFPKVRAFISSGDTLLFSNYEQLIQHTNIYNMYGPTETTVCATIKKCENNKNNPSIGKPLDGYEVLVDVNKSEVINGNNVGEIIIAGKGVTRGYINGNNENNGFKTINGKKFYYTGDYGYWKQGELFFVGRKDRQIKLKANRINLDEIESIIIKNENIFSVACVVKNSTSNSKCIVVYYVSDKLNNIELRAYCKEVLPYYINPIYFVKLDTIPISETGKKNYKMLEQKKDIEAQIADKDEIVDLIAEKLQNDDSQIDIDLELDSLDFIELVVMIESRFNIEFEDYFLDLAKFESTEDIYKYVKRRINNEEME